MFFQNFLFRGIQCRKSMRVGITVCANLSLTICCKIGIFVFNKQTPVVPFSGNKFLSKKHGERMKFKIIPAVVFVWLAIGITPLSAATLTVTSLADLGAGSLREAIGAAASGDTIEFALTGTISLSSQITIDKQLTISGPGETNLTISGGNSTRVFFLDNGADVVINDLSIADGRAVGGNGGNSGSKTGYGGNGAGGGGGAVGAGIFINTGAKVEIEAVTFDGNAAVGGNGGNATTSGTVIGAGGSGDTGIGGDGGDGSSSGVGAAINAEAGGFASGGGGGGSSSSCNPPIPSNQGIGGYMAGDGGHGGYSCTGTDGGGGGGGAGIGAAIFIYTGAQVTLKNVEFTNNTATGGTGGSRSGTISSAGENGNGKGAAVFAHEDVIVEAYDLSFSGNSSNTNANTDAINYDGTTINDNDDLYGKVTATPIPTNITSSVADGTYGETDVIPIQVTFSQPITATGSPELLLETGAIDGVAVYTSGSGTDTLTFNYTVGAGEGSGDLDANATGPQLSGSLTYEYNSQSYAAFGTVPTGTDSGSLATNKDISIAAEVLVTNTSGDAAVAGSLPYYVANAGDNTTIKFDASLAGATIIPDTTLEIDKNLTIDATDVNGIIVSGNDARRVFLVTAGTVRIKGLTITNGYVNDTDGSEYGGGAVYVTNGSTVFHMEQCTIKNCVVNGSYDDYSGYGAGILVNSATATITNCTFTGNTAAVSGGAVADWSGCDITIKNCTFTNNAGSHATTGTGALYLYNGDLTYGNSIIAGNTGTAASNFYNEDSGTFTSLGHNLSDGAMEGGAASGDLESKDLANEIKLGSLQDNGGPTPTLGIEAGSLAIDAGDDSLAPTTDQRGYARNGTSDIGAFEYANNDAPVQTVPGAQSTNEDTELVFSTANGNLLSVSDPDVGTTLTTVISVSNGTLTVTTGGGGTITGNGSSSVQIEGSVAQANAALDGTGYTPAADYSGSDTLVLSSTDNGALTDTDTVAITITAVNDAPVQTVPGAQSTNEDTELVFSMAYGNLLSVSDPDAGTTLTTVISVSNGTLTVAGGGGTITGNGSSSVQIEGSVAQVTAALDGTGYTPAADYSGSDTLVLSSTDNAALTDTDTVAIAITAVNDAPVQTVPGAQSTNEDTELVFSTANGNSLSVSDPDAGTTLTTVISVSNGTLTVAGGGGTITGNGSSSVQIEGSVAQVTAALDGTGYTPAADYSGTDTLVLSSTDNAALTDTDTVAITITAVNDAPVQTVPGAQSTNEDTELVFSAAYGNLLSVSDPDAGTTLTTVISVSNGILTVGSGGTITGNGSSSVQIEGSIAQVNAALDGTGYTPAADYSGSDTLVLSSTDNGALNDTDTVAITITALNDAPVISTITDQTTNEDTPVGPLAFTVTDADPLDSLTVTAASDDQILLPNANIVLGGSGTDRTITLTPAANASGGPVIITLTADDGTTNTVETFVLTVIAVNDDPSISGLPADVTVVEDTAGNVDLSTATFSDVDSGTGSVTLTLAAGSGVLSATSSGDVTISGSGTATLILSGTASNIDTYLNTASNIQYTGAPNANGNDAVTLTLTANDGGNTGSGGGINVSLGTINVDITAVNDVPVITGQESLHTTEETSLTITLDDLTVTDPDNTYPDDFSLSVQDGSEYTRSGNTITPAAGSGGGTLTVPVTVNDGTDDSNVYNLSVYVAIERAVINTNDSGAGSLRQILADAGEGDVIDLSGVTGTIMLSSGLTINKNVEITGSEEDGIVIDGGGANRVFDILSGAVVSLSDVTVSNGSVADTGGGINNAGDLTLTRVTVNGNTGTNGAGIYSNGNLTMKNCTVSNNIAPIEAGGIYNVLGGALTLNNCTIARNSTAAGTVGGLYNAGDLDIRNTLIADNRLGDDSPVDFGNSGTINTNTNNLVEYGSLDGAITDDPGLGLLQDNGGSAYTHGLAYGSVAIDAGDAGTAETADQRGNVRPIDGDADGTSVPDIGAFECSPGVIAFSAAAYNVSEDDGSITITVIRTGAGDGAASATYTTSDDTATAGSDYTAASGTLTWSSGDTSAKTFTITITDDITEEGAETVNLALDNITGAGVGNIVTAGLTIADDDTYYTLTTTVDGDGSGDITSDPSGIDCGSDCSAAYYAGTTITLTATSTDEYSLFSGWPGQCSGTGPCTISLAADTTITAVFDLLDTDGDGVPDCDDVFPADPNEWADGDGDGIGDNADTDHDNDGMPTEWENGNGLDPYTDDAGLDPDGDGLSNLEEYEIGTDPRTATPVLGAAVLVSPSNGAVGQSVTPTLQTTYGDGTDESAHTRTRWQIASDEGFGDILLDITSDDHIISLTVPVGVLDPYLTYFWRARYVDINDVAWPWSESWTFTTTEESEDANGNGLPDDQEVADGTESDLNGNGEADLSEGDMHCVTLPNGTGWSCLENEENGIVEEFFNVDVEEIPETEDKPEYLPYGLFGFRLVLDTPGDSVTVAKYYSVPLPEDIHWYKYDSVNGWFDYTGHVSFSENRKTVFIELTDGGCGDADGAVNGVIVDPSGPAMASDEDLYYTLITTVGGNGMGSITSSPSGIHCSSNCSAAYYAGTTVTLTATADNECSVFSGWSGQCSGTGPCTIELTADTVVTAVFSLPDTDGDGIIDCGDAFPSDPDEWADGDHDGIGDNADTDHDNDGMPTDWENENGLDPYTDDADRDPDGDGLSNLEEYEAGYDPQTPTSVLGTAVLLSPEDDTGDQSVTLTLETTYGANADESAHVATRWQIASDENFGEVLLDITSEDHIISLTVPEGVLDPYLTYFWRARYVDSDTTAWPWSETWSFTTTDDSSNDDIYYTLSTTAGGEGSGSITSSPSGINCGSDCSAVYYAGSTVTLTATADNECSVFSGWSDRCTGTGPCTIELTADTAVTAVFDLPDTDGDGVTDCGDAFPADPDEWADGDHDGIGDNADADHDNDGMPTDWENENGLNPYMDDADQDPDGDGLSNLEEYETGSDPRAKTTGLSRAVLAAPADGATGQPTTPTLETTYADDADASAHAKTRWQIASDAEFSDVLMDITSAIHTTDLIVPVGVLDPYLTYFWRARYVDIDNTVWPWSESWWFETTQEIFDNNGNGLPDDQELVEGTESDLNCDGVEDLSEADMHCIMFFDGSGWTCLESESGGVEKLFAIDPEEIPESDGQPDEFPYGLFGFRLVLDTPGDSVIVAKYYSETLPEDISWYKYDNVTGWSDYTGFVTFSEDRTAVFIELTDGGYGDADGMANGVIVDPSGPALFLESTTDEDESTVDGTETTASGSDSDGGGCFIAMATGDSIGLWCLLALIAGCLGFLPRKQN